MKRALLSAAMIFIVAQGAEACFQFFQGATKVRGDVLRIKVTYEDKPLVRARLTIHRAVTFSQEEVLKRGVLYGPNIAQADTDEFGNVTFQNIANGRYWIVMKSPSAESAAIEFEQTRDLGLRERFQMHFFSDYCHKYSVERI